MAEEKKESDNYTAAAIAGTVGSGLSAVAVAALGPVGAAILAVGALAALECAYQADQATNEGK